MLWLCADLLISDENGAYYWHIKSGTIQREAPIASPVDIHSPKDATSFTSVGVIVLDSLFTHYVTDDLSVLLCCHLVDGKSI